MRSSISEAPGPIAGSYHRDPENSSPNLETLHSLRQITIFYPLREAQIVIESWRRYLQHGQAARIARIDEKGH
jgi:hypothetical protein